LSNPDSFIDEVNEELRRDRLFAAMRKWGWVAAVGVVLLVGGAAWNEWRKAQAESQARAFGDQIIAALDRETPGERRDALAAVTASGAQAGILNLLLAATEIDAGRPEGALTALAAVEADATLPLSYRQIAALKRVILAGDRLPIAEREATLNGLATPGQPFRPLALEQLAILALEAGQTATALERARALLQEPDVSQGLRQRVEQLIVILGGETANG
jgi:hypothetical protein